MIMCIKMCTTPQVWVPVLICGRGVEYVYEYNYSTYTSTVQLRVQVELRVQVKVWVWEQVCGRDVDEYLDKYMYAYVEKQVEE